MALNLFCYAKLFEETEDNGIFRHHLDPDNRSHESLPTGKFIRRAGFSFRTDQDQGSLRRASRFKQHLIEAILNSSSEEMVIHREGKIILLPYAHFAYGGLWYYFDENPSAEVAEAHCMLSLSRLEQIDSVPDLMENKSDPVLLHKGTSTTSSVIKPHEALSLLQNANGERPKLITWSCILLLEECCGTECCFRGATEADKFLILMIAVLFMLLCCFGGYCVCCVAVLLSRPGNASNAGSCSSELAMDYLPQDTSTKSFQMNGEDPPNRHPAEQEKSTRCFGLISSKRKAKHEKQSCRSSTPKRRSPAKSTNVV